MEISFSGPLGWVVYILVWIWGAAFFCALLLGGLWLLWTINFVLIRRVYERLLSQWGVHKLFIRWICRRAYRAYKAKQDAQVNHYKNYQP